MTDMRQIFRSSMMTDDHTCINSSSSTIESSRVRGICSSLNTRWIWPQSVSSRRTYTKPLCLPSMSALFPMYPMLHRIPGIDTSADTCVRLRGFGLPVVYFRRFSQFIHRRKETRHRRVLFRM